MIALVLERLTAGRGFMMALLLIPWSMITVINAELWGYIYQGTYGVADAILNAVGLGHPNILGQPTSAIIGLDDRRHLEDHPVRGHHRAGRPGDAARGHLRGGRGGRLVGLVHLLADHRPAAAAHARAGGDVPRAAGVRAVRPALRADRRRPGHGDHLAGHPGLQRDLQEPRLRAGRGGRRPPPRCWCCSAACFRCGPSGSRSGRKETNAQSQADRLAPGHQRRQHLRVLRRPVRRAAAVLADRLQLQDAGEPGGQPAAVLPEPDQHRELPRRLRERTTSASTSATRSS